MKDRILEVAICIESVIILVLITIVIHFITNSVSLDLNKDGIVDISDLAIKVNEAVEIRDYILNENQDIGEK